jgi:hypothetical protein
MITFGVPGGIGVLNPLLGEIVGIVELLAAVAVTITIMSAALFGKPDLSDRAFRLLRWIRSQPEPPARCESVPEIGGPLTDPACSYDARTATARRPVSGASGSYYPD